MNSRDRSRWPRNHLFSRRGEVGTVDKGGSGVTSTAVASVGLIRQGVDPCYARILQKGVREWRDSGDLRITEYRTEKPDAELPSKMGKQRTSRETPFCKKAPQHAVNLKWVAIKGTGAYLLPS